MKKSYIKITVSNLLVSILIFIDNKYFLKYIKFVLINNYSNFKICTKTLDTKKLFINNKN